jgi:ribosome-binding protein aMBF1 (putative translation factor)
MKLLGLHTLVIDDLTYVRRLFDTIIIEDETAEPQPETAPEAPAGPTVGYRKNEAKPIAKAMRSAGKSQAEIAKELEVHPSTVSRYKSDEPGIKRRPSFKTMVRLSKTLGSVSKVFPELA